MYNKDNNNKEKHALKNNIFSQFFKKKELNTDAIRHDLLGWHSTGGFNALKYYKDNQYENGYGSIQAIAKQFWNAVPFAVDARGKRVRYANIVDVLGHPNKNMSGLDFREALAVMSLVQDKVYIRVHYDGINPSEENVYGFTILENVTEVVGDEENTYMGSDGIVLHEKDVIVLKNVNPYDLTSGYSTARAVHRWARVDDLIASYQAGFFENGAKPQGIMQIHAPNQQEFEDIAFNLKRAHQGSGKNNNIVYDFVQNDPVTGQKGSGSITWVPTDSSNSDLALPDLFAQVNEKIDSAYGVPASMRGVNDNNTYASVRVDQEIFIDNAVRPFATKIWTRFTHELNRVTGGLGYAITVEIETPHVAEEDEAYSRIKGQDTTTLTHLLDKGFTLESAVKALGLSEDYLLLERAEVEEPVIEDVEEEVDEDDAVVDEASIDEGDEVEDSPDSKNIEALDIRCKHCNWYLFKATGTTVVEDMPCPKCKARLNFKIINPLGDDHTHKFEFVETQPKNWKYIAKSKSLSEEQIAAIESKVAGVIRKQMETQVSSVDIKSKALSDSDKETAELYAKEIASIVEPLMVSEGVKQTLTARGIEGVVAEEITDFKLSDSQMKRYQQYLTTIVKGYAEDTQKSIKKVLEDSIGNNLPEHDTRLALKSVMNTDEWRVQRLSKTETYRAANNGQVYAMEKIAKETDLNIQKVWQLGNGDHCEYCRSLDGKAVGVSEDFVGKGETIEGVDGGSFVNDFGHMDVSTAHPNCSCYTTYKVVK